MAFAFTTPPPMLSKQCVKNTIWRGTKNKSNFRDLYKQKFFRCLERSLKEKLLLLLWRMHHHTTIKIAASSKMRTLLSSYFAKNTFSKGYQTHHQRLPWSTVGKKSLKSVIFHIKKCQFWAFSNKLNKKPKKPYISKRLIFEFSRHF